METPRTWLVLTIPIFLLAGWLLVRTIAGLVRGLRHATILALPMAPSQSVNFPLSGQLDLYLEGRRAANLSGLDFSLRDQQGTTVPLDSIVLRTTVSGGSRVRIKVRSFHLPHDGSYALDISGLRPGMDPKNRVVVSRPVGGLIVRHVLALVGLGILLAGSLAGSIFLLVSRR